MATARPLLLNPALRTFVALGELGTLPLTAERMHRSASAISLQMTNLEERLGRQLFVRSARGMTLTPAGQRLLQHAQAMLALENAAQRDMADLEVAGKVRFGMPQDFAASRLAGALAAFRKAHSRVSVTAVVERCNTIAAMVARGELDLAVLIGRRAAPHSLVVSRQPTLWQAAAGFEWDGRAALPLVLMEPPCIYRDDALQTLGRMGIRYELAFATASVSGMWAAVQAGVGVTARMGLGAPADVVDVTAQVHGARLSAATLSLVRPCRTADDAVAALASHVAAEIGGKH